MTIINKQRLVTAAAACAADGGSACTKPAIYKTDNGKVIVEDELLNFIVVNVYQSDALLGDVKVPKDALLCRDMNCKNVQHCKIYVPCMKLLWSPLVSRVGHYINPAQKCAMLSQDGRIM